MTNAFLKRATEFIRDEATLISIVSPEPFKTYYAKYANNDALLDLPVRVIGSPGSGKTTISMATEFKVMEKVLLDLSNERSKDLAAAYENCKFLHNGRPRIAAIRLPMESEYRDFWELPYEALVKNKLLWTAIQAKTVLALIRQLTTGGTRTIEDVEFIFKEEAEAAIELIGGPTAIGIRDRARDVDRAIYNITASLVPPAQANFDELVQAPYNPFGVIREIRIKWLANETILVRPLVILDDAHTLHPDQFELLFRDLARRETKISRWVMMRMDRLSPKYVLGIADEIELPELKKDRDYLEIRLQSGGTRSTDRRVFRKLADDMANRYLQLVRPIRDRNISEFSALLGEAPPVLSVPEMDRLRDLIETERNKLGISHKRSDEFAKQVSDYAESAKSIDINEDVQLMMRRVMLHRYANRVPQQELFSGPSDPEPRTPIQPNASVADAARLFLKRDFKRPLHYGFDTLCDASQENAELFLHLAGALVARSEARIIRGQTATLTPAQQQDELQRRATEIIEAWAFPFARNVRTLVSKMAEECIEDSRKLNARLGGGANAFGIPSNEISELLQGTSETALVLKYAFAYDAINIVPDYGQGGKNWFLVELSGVVCLKHNLNLKRGNFLERRIQDIHAILSET